MKKFLWIAMLCLFIVGAFACATNETPSESVSSTENSYVEGSSPIGGGSHEEDSVEDSSEGDSASEDKSKEDSSEEGGDEDAPSVYKITFTQGEKVYVRYVNVGESLIDIPSVQPVAGYDAKWSVTSFENIQEDIDVTVLLTAKTFTITYDLGGNGYMYSTKQKVVYKSEYTLREATRTDYTLVGWKVKGTDAVLPLSGAYEWTEDITLVPVWKWSGQEEWTK